MEGTPESLICQFPIGVVANRALYESMYSTTSANVFLNSEDVRHNDISQTAFAF